MIMIKIVASFILFCFGTEIMALSIDDARGRASPEVLRACVIERKWDNDILINKAAWSAVLKSGDIDSSIAMHVANVIIAGSHDLTWGSYAELYGIVVNTMWISNPRHTAIIIRKFVSSLPKEVSRDEAIELMRASGWKSVDDLLTVVYISDERLSQRTPPFSIER